MEENSSLIDVWLRFFHWPEADGHSQELLKEAQPTPKPSDHTPSYQNLVGFLSKRDRDVSWYVDRYNQLATHDHFFKFAVPYERTLVERLYEPLLNAKRNFVLGNPLGTIVTCGFVAEMIALIRFNIYVARLGRCAHNEMLRSDFEGLGQYKRLERLEELGLIGSETKKCFSRIKQTRNKYLHRINYSFDGLDDDAMRVYGDTEIILQEFLCIKPTENGTIELREEILFYLRDLEKHEVLSGSSSQS